MESCISVHEVSTGNVFVQFDVTFADRSHNFRSHFRNLLTFFTLNPSAISHSRTNSLESCFWVARLFLKAGLGNLWHRSNGLSREYGFRPSDTFPLLCQSQFIFGINQISFVFCCQFEYRVQNRANVYFSKISYSSGVKGAELEFLL